MSRTFLTFALGCLMACTFNNSSRAQQSGQPDGDEDSCRVALLGLDYGFTLGLGACGSCPAIVRDENDAGPTCPVCPALHASQTKVSVEAKSCPVCPALHANQSKESAEAKSCPACPALHANQTQATVEAKSCPACPALHANQTQATVEAKSCPACPGSPALVATFTATVDKCLDCPSCKNKDAQADCCKSSCSTPGCTKPNCNTFSCTPAENTNTEIETLENKTSEPNRQMALMLHGALRSCQTEKEAIRTIERAMEIVSRQTKDQFKTDMALLQLEHQKEMGEVTGRLLQTQGQLATVESLRQWMGPLYSNLNRNHQELQRLASGSAELHRTVNQLQKATSPTLQRPPRHAMPKPVTHERLTDQPRNQHSNAFSANEMKMLEEQISRTLRAFQQAEQSQLRHAEHLQPILEPKRLSPLFFGGVER